MSIFWCCSPEAFRPGSLWSGFCVDAENGLSEPQGEFDVFCIVFSKVLCILESQKF